MRKKSRPGLLPAISSPFWEERAKPLVGFLHEPRNWFELTVWARSLKIGGYLLRNFLAFLEDKGIAEAISVRVKSSGEILWIWRLVDPSRKDDGLYIGYERIDPSQIYKDRDKDDGVSSTNSLEDEKDDGLDDEEEDVGE